MFSKLKSSKLSKQHPELAAPLMADAPHDGSDHQPGDHMAVAAEPKAAVHAQARKESEQKEGQASDKNAAHKDGAKQEVKAAPQLAPQPAPAAPLVLHRGEEGFNLDAWVKHCDQQIETLRKQAYSFMRQERVLDVIAKRESPISQDIFYQQHPRLSHGLQKFAFMSDYLPHVMFVGSVAGAGALQQLYKSNQPEAFKDLLISYMVSVCSYFGYQCMKETKNKYTGSKRLLQKALHDKNLMAEEDFDILENSIGPWTEKLLNLTSMAIVIYGSTQVADINNALKLTLIGNAVQVLASVTNYASKLRFAQELAQMEFNIYRAPWTPAFLKSAVSGVLEIITGAALAFFQLEEIDSHPENHRAASIKSYIGFGLFSMGVFSTMGLTWRTRGSDYIKYVMDDLLHLKVGDKDLGDEYLKSYFLGFRESRSDVDDAFCWLSATAMLSLIANEFSHAEQMGDALTYLAVMGTVYTLNLLVHTYDRTLAQRYLAVASCEPDELLLDTRLQQTPVPAARQPDADRNCYMKMLDGMSDGMHRFYRFFTKTEYSCGKKPAAPVADVEAPAVRAAQP